MTTRERHPSRDIAAASGDLPRPALDIAAEIAGMTLPDGGAAILRNGLDAASCAAEAEQVLAGTGVSLISRQSLDGFGIENSARIIRMLRRAGLIEPSGVHGVWRLPGGRVDAGGIIAATLHVNPDSRMSWKGGVMPVVMGWTRRGCGEFGINVPPSQTIPAALRSRARRRAASVRVSRWEPKAPFWSGFGMPMFSASTEIAYIAARPTRYNMTELPEFLADIAAHVDEAELLAELGDQPRAVWMRCCVLLQYGLRRDLADAVFSSAPPGTGPYYLVDRDREWEKEHERTRAWYPKYQVYDLSSPSSYTSQMHRRGGGASTPDDLREAIDAGTDGAIVTFCGDTIDLVTA